MKTGRERHITWGSLALALAIGAVVFSSSFSNGFLSWDDPSNVTGNPAIRAFTWAHLRTWFTEPLLGVYSPLVYLSYAVDYRLAGLNPAMYHATNLALHLACVVLVFGILVRLTRRPVPAVILAALFAVHPANVAAVTPISVRSSLLFAFFYLAAYLAYLSGHPSHPAPRTAHRAPAPLVFSFVLFVLSALSKPAAAVFPVLMLLTDYCRERRMSWPVVIEKVPFFVVSIALGVAALAFRTDMATGTPLATSVLERVSLAAWQLGSYAVKAIVPVGLSAYYPYPERIGGSLPISVWLAPLLLLVAAALVWRARAHRRLLVFGLLFFALHLALVLKLVPLGAEFTADRYLYVPMIGLAVMVAELAGRLPRVARRVAVVAALAVVAGWSVMSYARSAEWRNDMTFYTRIIDRYPTAAVAYANRAGTRLQSSDVDGALRDSTDAIRLDSSNVQAYFNRATAQMIRGQAREALADATRAIDLNPRFPASFALRAQARLSMADYAGARDDAARAIDLAPEADDLFKPLVTRGMARAMLGDGRGALEDLDRAVLLNPQEPALLYNRGQVKVANGDLAGGCADLRLAAARGRADAGAMAAELCRGR